MRHDAGGAYTGNPCFNDTGYTAPTGYPKGDTRFTNNKVIVARAYFRPGDPPIAGEDTAIQGTNAASPHGTHVAGTVACNAGTPATFLGAHRARSPASRRSAYLMNYRVFYPSQSTEDFQNGNAYIGRARQGDRGRRQGRRRRDLELRGARATRTRSPGPTR